LLAPTLFLNNLCDFSIPFSKPDPNTKRSISHFRTRNGFPDVNGIALDKMKRRGELLGETKLKNHQTVGSAKDGTYIDYVI